MTLPQVMRSARTLYRTACSPATSRMKISTKRNVAGRAADAGVALVRLGVDQEHRRLVIFESVTPRSCGLLHRTRRAVLGP